ncbi:(2Fe-2S)-binding protein [Limibacillus halophilus]|uniref:Aerobic-type carbon monoxide dehydrogenase small subunit (CoxS/CutS family) n=1 Tax=Limibacillus halophilus TaxID=1579333 RepID=A0A839SQI3_9PROT|nr:(2Fe-2S)-binding protein [Limibacillus halophilus]MBB3064498.1 aerobic-type carbon monoxide dehydrogenase small subunit (CoxS/CutS family) [Limibacillus halophilus]
MISRTNQTEVSFTVNGELIAESAPVRMHAADFLRQKLGLTGTHIGCEQGVCGMCTITVDGQVVKSCLMLAVQLDGRNVCTVEALSEGNRLSLLQESFKRHHALQCGFCTPAFLCVAKSLESHGRVLSKEEIREEIAGVLCRCTGYEGIVNAIEEYLTAALDAGANQKEAEA